MGSERCRSSLSLISFFFFWEDSNSPMDSFSKRGIFGSVQRPGWKEQPGIAEESLPMTGDGMGWDLRSL